MMDLICLGDSLTYGFHTRRSKIWTTLLSQNTDFHVLNYGVSGDTTAGMLVRLRTDIFPYLQSRNYECQVLIMGGSNDIFYSGTDLSARSNIGAMTNQLLSVGIDPIIGIPLPIDVNHTPVPWRHAVDFEQSNIILNSYKEWLRKYCVSFGFRSLDFEGLFKAEDGSIKKELLQDGLHPNNKGHQLIAEALKKELGHMLSDDQ